MDEIESISLSGNPAHAKYETEVLSKDVFLFRLTMVWWVSTVYVSGGWHWGACRDLSGASLLHSGQAQATRACGWAPVIPGAGLPGWQSPGEVTPACQNLSALDRELFLGRIRTLASAVCKAWWVGKTSLEGGERCLPFSPQSGFPILNASSNIRNVTCMTGLWFQ